MMPEESPLNEYDTEQIQVLTLPESIQKRPGMYFGSIGPPAIEQFIYELVSNVLDCYLSNTATFVKIAIDGDMIIIIDDGPGLPFELPSDIDETSLATKFLTVLHSSGSADAHAPHIHIPNSFGCGLAILNAASSQLRVQSWRNGERWEQQFVAGKPLSKPIIIARASDAANNSLRGTKIEIVPSPELFPRAQPRMDLVRWHLFEAAHLVKGIKIIFQQEQFYAPQGLVQLLPFLHVDPAHLYFDRWNRQYLGTQTFHHTIKSNQVLIDVVAHDATNEMILAIAETPQSPQIYSWANGAMLPYGGSHVEGFLRALAEVNWQPKFLMIHVVMFNPEFAGPTRTKLVVPAISQIVYEALLHPLQLYVDTLKE
jgi:DNA gyrase subunit B